MKTHQQKADIIAKKVAKHLKTKIESYLGEGSEGYAFLLKNGQVLKLTSSSQEYIQSTLLVGRVSKHICRIYKTYRIQDTEFAGFICRYAIIQEFLDTSNKDYLSELNENTDLFLAFRLTLHLSSGFEGVVEPNEEQIGRFLEEAEEFLDANPPKDPRLNNLIQQSRDLTEEVTSISMRNMDFHSGNVGFRGDDLVLFDLGFSANISKVHDEILTLS
jgi:hypothetical protein